MLIDIILAALSLALLAQVVMQYRHHKNLLQKYKNDVEQNRQEGINRALLNEIEKLQQEKEKELKLRSEAEKQVEIALQQTSEVQKRIDDLKTIQETNLKDAIDAITNVGDDLYDRISEELQDQLNTKITDLYDYLDKISNQIELLSASSNSGAMQKVDHIAVSLEKMLKDSHLQLNTDYFARYKLPENVRKSALCEFFIIINHESAVLVDTKSCQFFADFAHDQANNVENAEELLKHKIDRYIAYLTNPKYKAKIINYFVKEKVIKQNVNNVLIMLVPSQKEIDEFNNLGEDYIEILQDNNILLHSLESFGEVISG